MAKIENDERVAMVRGQLRLWCEGRKIGQRIPAELWQAIVGLAESYSVEQVAAAFSVNKQQLAKRAGVEEGRIATQGEPAWTGHSGFVEIGVAGSGDVPEAACSIETRSPDGRTLVVRVPVSASAVVVQVVHALWGRGA